MKVFHVQAYIPQIPGCLVYFEVAQKGQTPPGQGFVGTDRVIPGILPFGVWCKLFQVHLMCSRVKEAEYSYKILFGKSERHLWCLQYIRCSVTFFHVLY